MWDSLSIELLIICTFWVIVFLFYYKYVKEQKCYKEG